MHSNFYLHFFARAGLDRERLFQIATEKNPEDAWRKEKGKQKIEIKEEEEAKLLEKEKISLLSIRDPDYPELLRHIYLPPALLYIKGKIPEGSSVAVVGTRKASAYGLEATRTIASQLAQTGIIITSGLAYGIDTEAHKAALNSGGKTMAVLGSGIDNPSIFPQINVRLANEIIEKGGALISEYPPGTPGLPHHFPERNRIISGLSLGTIVTEAPVKSGAMITARLALEQNREVFAVPGQIFHLNSEGPLRLIQQGAHVALSGDDVLSALGLSTTQIIEKSLENLTDQEKLLVSLVKESPKQLDEIIQELNIPTHEAISLVSILEIKGIIKDIGQKNYRLV